MSDNLIFVAKRGPAYQPDPNAVPEDPVVNVQGLGQPRIEVVRANPEALFDPEPQQDVSLFYDGAGRLERVEGSVSGVLATLGYDIGTGALDTVTSAQGTAQLAYTDGQLTTLTWI